MRSPSTTRDALSVTALRLIAYYDIFRHPLTIPELSRLAGADVGVAIERLVQEGVVERTRAHVYLAGQGAQVARRQERTAAAERRWPAARRAGRLLADFPWVRAVLVTGGMSKSSTEDGGDVDFMLLVEPGHVWAAKSALQVLRRALPAGVRECFCTNYLLATDALELDDRNMFTAMELATAIPLHGSAWSVALLEANRSWAEAFVPGMGWSVERASHAPDHPPRAGRLVEALTEPLGPHHERVAMHLWDRYWNRKYAWLDDDVRAQRFKRRPEIATNHLHDFQVYVISEYTRRCSAVGIAP